LLRFAGLSYSPPELELGLGFEVGLGFRIWISVCG